MHVFGRWSHKIHALFWKIIAWNPDPKSKVHIFLAVWHLDSISRLIQQALIMPNYRRLTVAGGTYFITQVTYQREAWLCSDIGRKALREAITNVRKNYPFSIEAFVLLPDHFHCLLTLPDDDKDFSVRLRLIKTYVTKYYGEQLGIDRVVSSSRQKRKERNLWQRRFWEHLIRNERDYALHCDYIHYNPVKHGLCLKPQDWAFSSIHRFIAEGVYPPDWGMIETPVIPDNIGDE